MRQHPPPGKQTGIEGCPLYPILMAVRWFYIRIIPFYTPPPYFFQVSPSFHCPASLRLFGSNGLFPLNSFFPPQKKYKPTSEFEPSSGVSPTARTRPLSIDYHTPFGSHTRFESFAPHLPCIQFMWGLFYYLPTHPRYGAFVQPYTLAYNGEGSLT